MRVDLVTLFPELFTPFLDLGFVGKARGLGVLHTRTRSPRDFGLGKHRSVDDTPYGGGSGMVMRVDCLVQTLEALDVEAGGRAHRILLTPQGAPFHQRKAVELSARPAIALICCRYEGPDARVGRYVDEEISLGDFVMTGGEVAAMAVLESVIRLLPGVLGNEESTKEESHSPETGGLLEYPHYTRPLEFRGDVVPEVLRGGNHAAIAAWRHQRSLELTGQRRPELLAAYLAAHPPPPPKKARRKRRPAEVKIDPPEDPYTQGDEVGADHEPLEPPDASDLPGAGALPGAGPRAADHPDDGDEPGSARHGAERADLRSDGVLRGASDRGAAGAGGEDPRALDGRERGEADPGQAGGAEADRGGDEPGGDEGRAGAPARGRPGALDDGGAGALDGDELPGGPGTAVVGRADGGAGVRDRVGAGAGSAGSGSGTTGADRGARKLEPPVGAGSVRDHAGSVAGLSP